MREDLFLSHENESYEPFSGAVVKLVDTRDLKSLCSNAVPVQVRPALLLEFFVNSL